MSEYEKKLTALREERRELQAQIFQRLEPYPTKDIYAACGDKGPGFTTIEKAFRRWDSNDNPPDDVCSEWILIALGRALDKLSAKSYQTIIIWADDINRAVAQVQKQVEAQGGLVARWRGITEDSKETSIGKRFTVQVDVISGEEA